MGRGRASATHITSKELTIPYLLAANAVDKNPAWASQGTRPKTMENIIFLRGARRAQILIDCTILSLIENQWKRCETKHFRNSYRLQPTGTCHARALHLRKNVVVALQNP